MMPGASEVKLCWIESRQLHNREFPSEQAALDFIVQNDFSGFAQILEPTGKVRVNLARDAGELALHRVD
jgi:hypothetical protein